MGCRVKGARCVAQGAACWVLDVRFSDFRWGGV